MFKVLGVDHIGIASTDLADGEFWKLLGLKCTGEETVAEQKVTTAFYPTTDDKEHGEIELLVASEAGSPIEKFIEKNGGRGGIQARDSETLTARDFRYETVLKAA